jgi:hypothetical protein
MADGIASSRNMQPATNLINFMIHINREWVYLASTIMNMAQTGN